MVIELDTAYLEPTKKYSARYSTENLNMVYNLVSAGRSYEDAAEEVGFDLSLLMPHLKKHLLKTKKNSQIVWDTIMRNGGLTKKESLDRISKNIELIETQLPKFPKLGYVIGRWEQISSGIAVRVNEAIDDKEIVKQDFRDHLKGCMGIIGLSYSPHKVYVWMVRNKVNLRSNRDYMDNQLVEKFLHRYPAILGVA